jgi:hypothetical protein
LTTIACNTEEMYSDLQYTNHSTGFKFKGDGKVYRFEPNELFPFSYLIGFTGSASDVVTAVSYLSRPDLFKKPPAARVSGLVVTDKHKIFMFEHYLKWVEIHAKYAAAGSGSEFAIGALAQGATPKEAVKVAMQHDVYTGMGIKGYKI